jgi:hypothetical protein
MKAKHDAGRTVQRTDVRRERRWAKAAAQHEAAVDELADEEDRLARQRLEARPGYDDWLSESLAYVLAKPLDP